MVNGKQNNKITLTFKFLFFIRKIIINKKMKGLTSLFHYFFNRTDETSHIAFNIGSKARYSIFSIQNFDGLC